MAMAKTDKKTYVAENGVKILKLHSEDRQFHRVWDLYAVYQNSSEKLT